MTASARWVRWVSLITGVFVATGLGGGCGGEEVAQRTTAAAAESSADVRRPAIGFLTPRRLDEHYAKHGSEFGSVSREEYLRRAQALRDGPSGGAVLEIVRRDGTVTRFDRATGAFIAFASDGVIRTFFRPNDGEQYFRRQAGR